MILELRDHLQLIGMAVWLIINSIEQFQRLIIKNIKLI